MIKIVLLITLMFVMYACEEKRKNVSDDNKELTPIESPADTSSAEPYLYTDDNGVVHLSWVEKKGMTHLFKFSRLIKDHWSEPVLISSGSNWFVNWADYPMLVTDRKGNMFAHYLQKSGSGTYAYDIKLVTSSDSGKTWSEPKILHDDGKQAEHGFVSMTPYGENILIAWLDGRNTGSESAGGHGGHHGEMTIRAAVIDKYGKKSGEWELDNRVCDCCQTSTIITTDGPIVVYRDRTENETRDISIVRFINQKWTAPVSVFQDQWKIDGCPVNGPRVDAVGNNVVVTWFTTIDKNGLVNIIFSGDGGASFEAPIRVDEGKGIGRVDVVMLDSSSAVVSWMEGSDIKASRIYRDGKKDAIIRIATNSDSRSSGFPQMTKKGNQLVFAWTDVKSKKVQTAVLNL